MEAGLVTILMFGSFILCIMMGVPLAWGLGSVGIIFTIWLWGVPGLYVVAARTLATMSSPTVIAVPLFILMGTMLQYSGLADALYTMVHRWAGRMRGALAMGTIVICILIGAMSGISGAAAISLGMIALPSMLKRNYDKRLSIGTIAGGSTLCLLIPPSITLILFGAMSNVSIGQMFIAGVVPGLLLASLFIIYLAIKAWLQPELMPALAVEERVSRKEKIGSLIAALPVLIVIVGVLGSIFTGAATPTEAAAVGAVLTIGTSALYGRLNWQLIRTSTIQAMKVNAMVMWILVGAHVFSSVYQALGATEYINSFILGMEASRWVVLSGILLIVLVMGMFIDPGAIVIVVVPIAVPILEKLGFNILWFAILFNIAIMIGYLSPPFGLVLFYMKGVCQQVEIQETITIGDIYRAVLPFVAIEIFAIVLLMIFPEIVLWLPRLVMGGGG
jgi:tripartite ATP-independent transporter DctM subunit